MPTLLAGFHTPEIIIMCTTAAWIIAFVHCIINRRLSGSSKIGWIILIFLANWIGAAIYLIYWFGFARHQRRQVRPMRQPTPVYTPSEREYSSYTQGYQSLKRAAPIKPFIADLAEPEEAMNASAEQIQIMYPEDPR